MSAGKDKLLTVDMKLLLGMALSSTICIDGPVSTLRQVNK